MKINLDYVRKKAQYDQNATKQRKLDGSPICICYNNAIVLPFLDPAQQLGGVISESDQFIDNSGLYEERKVGRYMYEESSIAEKSETVLYLGMLLSIYGHAITDDLKKIWSFKDKSLKYDRIVYIADWQKGKIPLHVKRIFTLIGLDIEKCEHITQITRYKKIIIPENSFVHHNGEKYYYEIINDTYDTIKRNINCNRSFGEKIYFSRTKIKQQWQREIGEKSIERVFDSIGYNVVHPETLTIDEQISAMMHCTSFASTEGSIAHNTVFCKPGTNVVLIKKCDIFNQWQFAVNGIADLNVTYIDAHRSIRTNKQFPMIGPFYLCITQELERYAGRRFLRVPFFLSISWYIYKYQIKNKCWYQKIIKGINKIDGFKFY